MAPSSLKSNDNNENNIINQLLYRYLPYWPLFLVLLIICLAGSFVYLNYYKIPLYESKASILIKDETKGVDDSRAMESFNLLSTKKIVENEIEVLKSRTLMDPVVKQLALYAEVYEKDRFVARSAYESSPIHIDIKNPEKIIDQIEIPFDYDEKKGQVIFEGAAYPLNKWVETSYGTFKFSPNRFRTRLHENPLYLQLINPKNITQSLQSKLSVSATNKLSTVINISLKDESPKRSENILNSLLDEYSRSALSLKNALASNTLSFIEDRLVAMGKELDQLEEKIQRYKSRSSAVDISTQGRLFLENVSINDQKLSDINMQLAVLAQVERYVTSKERTGSIVPSTLGVENPVLGQLMDRLYQAELEYERLKKTTAENNPIMVSLSDQIEKIKPSILENIRSQRNSLSTSKSNVISTNNAYASMLQSIPTKEKELLEISRDQEIKRSIYNFLVQKREEAALSNASTVMDSRIINQAQSSLAPVSISNKMIYLLFGGIALLIGIGIIAIKEVLNRKILFRHEIEKLTSIPIVAEIFQDVNDKQIVIEEGKRNPTAEQFRKLRTAFSFIGLDTRRKRLLVTSSISGEGKSFIASNLAISVALTKKKVVLVESDLINPSLSKHLGISNDFGLSDYLKGEREPEEVIRSTSLSPNLFIITSGPLPNNPSELIVNQRMEQLLNHLNKIFDLIIVDAPPVIPVSDAYVLSSYCNATLFVIRHKYTPKIFVQRIDEHNKINHLTNTAIVFNGIQPRGFNKSFYGYGYGYGYIFKGDNTEKKQSLST